MRLEDIREIADNLRPSLPDYVTDVVELKHDGIQYALHYLRDGKQYHCVTHFRVERTDLRHALFEMESAIELMGEAIAEGLPCA